MCQLWEDPPHNSFLLKALRKTITHPADMQGPVWVKPGEAKGPVLASAPHLLTPSNFFRDTSIGSIKSFITNIFQSIHNCTAPANHLKI